MGDNKNFIPDEFIFENRPKDLDNDVVSDKKKTISYLKNDLEFMKRIKLQYIKNTRKIQPSIFCEKRDRRFVLTEKDSFIFKSIIKLEYSLSGLDAKSRIKRMLLFLFVFGGFLSFFQLQYISKIIYNFSNILVDLLFNVYVNEDVVLNIPDSLDVSQSFLFKFFVTIKIKCQVMLDLYLNWPNIKMWDWSHWFLFVGIALRSVLWIDYFIKNIFTSTNIFEWTNYDMIAACFFVSGYVVSIINSIHCVEPVHYAITSSWKYTKDVVTTYINPKEKYNEVVDWYTWVKRSREPQIHNLMDYFKRWIFRVNHSVSNPWNGSNFEKSCEEYQRTRELQKDIDRLKSLTKKKN